MAGITWTQEEELLLREKCGTNISFKEMSKFFDIRTPSSLQTKAKLMNLSNYFKPRKYTCDKHFWDEVNPINSYWAGFIAADGSVRNNDGTYTLSIELQNSDVGFLELFKRAIQFDGKIISHTRAKRGRAGFNHSVTISINEKMWQKPLEENFHIFPRKTWNFTPPNLSDEMMEYWIAGFIDGDGCYHECKIRKYLGISASLATKESLERILLWSNRFPQQRKRSRKLEKTKRGYFRISIGGQAAAHMAHYLMSLPCHHLERKYLYVKEFLDKNPEFNLSLPPYEEKMRELNLQS